MMHMTFYWSKNVTLLFTSWKTDSWTSYALTLIACFIFSVFYQYMEDLRLRFKLLISNSVTSSSSSSPIEAPLLSLKSTSGGGLFSPLRVASGVLFGINSAIGYMLMLAVMSFNGGVFVAIVVGLAVGFWGFRCGVDDVVGGAGGGVVVVDNPCACA